jgi:Amino acid permease
VFQVIAYGVGNIIGAGIYVLVGDASGLAGGMVWLAFLVGAVVALFTGLSYAELAAMYPRAASEYIFLGRAYGNRTLSFLTQWMMLVTEVVAAAAVALGFAGYFMTVVKVPLVPTAAVLLILLTVIASTGIKQSLKLNTVLSVVAIVGLIVVVGVGIGKLGSVSYVSTANGIPGVLAATVLVFFSYIGFDNISNLSEETREPEKTIPKALLASINPPLRLGWPRLGEPCALASARGLRGATRARGLVRPGTIRLGFPDNRGAADDPQHGSGPPTCQFEDTLRAGARGRAPPAPRAGEQEDASACGRLYRDACDSARHPSIGPDWRHSQSDELRISPHICAREPRSPSSAASGSTFG